MATKTRSSHGVAACVAFSTLFVQILLIVIFIRVGLPWVVPAAVALVTSVVAGSAAYWFAESRFVIPFRRLVNRMRSSREVEEGELPETIELIEESDLQAVVIEFNGLIEEQHKAARQVKVKQQYLEYAAHHDPLTHLANRLKFDEYLKDTVRQTVRNEAAFSIYLIDLDNFKFFNDQYGHEIGDNMVVEVGRRLASMVRETDLVARLDGDEFVVIQKEAVDKETAEIIARRLMGTVTAPYEYRGFSLKASVSVGISCFPGDVHLQNDLSSIGEEIVNNASVALQDAKAKGKNQYQLFNESMRSRITDRLSLEQDIKIALVEDQFEVYYQPKIDIKTLKVSGAEALVRWKHPTRGMVSPELFIPLAEETGLIMELGEWILRTACRQTHMLQEIGFRGLNVAVNISAVQFTDGNLLSMVSKALKDSELSSSLLELEITESAVMHDPEEVVNSLHQLSRFGMKLAIDDFGTGYSSLAYLKRFPVDTLKIDRAFITDVSVDGDDVAIVEAILGLGRHFGMKVVAEGVEDKDQLKFLRQQGCDIAQGYFISKPLTLQQYIKWLEAWPYGITGAFDLDDSTDAQVSKVTKLNTQKRAS
ncbi:MAG: bifunctional diguanylate cyclase/phosphodiesterase [Granulosicoccus sp.]|nr:bifunctional diguanylate cyclase/phosphodiesterase [Granulosicoccus sp.]